MKRIPEKLKKALASDPEYQRCSLKGLNDACGGRVTWEHAIIFGSNQVQERWAIIPLCERHHAVGTYQDAGTCDKSRNVWVALNRASDQELLSVSKAVNWIRERDRLNSIYGKYTPPPISKTFSVI